MPSPAPEVEIYNHYKEDCRRNREVALNCNDFLKDKAMTERYWKNKIRNCSVCGKDMSNINPTFTVKGKRDFEACSKKCRATVTGEHWEEEKPVHTVAQARSEQHINPNSEHVAGIQTAGPATKKTGKPEKAPGTEAPKAGRASAAPWANLTGKMHITGKKPPNFSGNRKQVWEMIKEGMTVGELYGKCDKAGLDGKSNLAKIIGVYGCVEVK